MADVLVLGASGAVGSALRTRIDAGGSTALYASRTPPLDTEPEATTPATAALPIRWRVLDLERDALPVADALLSAGPLDHFVAALERSNACRPRTIVALSSSSADFKQESTDPQEAALAVRLLEAETRLQSCAKDRGARCVILRPTLVHGGDDSASFGAIARAAGRARVVILPRTATGLRMPVHADELAQCMLGALDNPDASGLFPVGGGEQLRYDEMVRRVLRARGIVVPVLRVPDALFDAVLKLAHRRGRMRALTPAIVQRMREDLVVDDSGARRLLGHAPGVFRPLDPQATRDRVSV